MQLLRHRHLGLLLLVAAVGDAAHAQVISPEAQTRFAETAVVRALGFQQGNLRSLVDATPDFTEAAWAEFMKRLSGWLDGSGVPTFSSAFVPSGAPINVREDKGVLSLTFPGVLRHESRNAAGGTSTTSYRAEIDVRVSANASKVEFLAQRTCGGATTIASCR